MAQKTSPFIEGKYGWDLGESGWNSGMDENLLKFSYLLDRNIDGVVATLPTATNGQAYFLTTDNRVYYSVSGFWYSSSVPKWFSFTVKGTGQEYLYTGTNIISQRSKADINTQLDSLSTSVSSLGSAAYKNTSDFTTPTYVNGKLADLANTSNTALGSNLIGFEGKTLYNALQQFKLPLKNVVFSEDPQFNGNIVAAAAAVADNMTLIISQPYTITAPLRFVGKTNITVTCIGAGRLIGSRTAFTFPTANARGILHFDNCINPLAYKVNILGALTAKSTFGADVKQDGDAGIEYYQCTSPRTIECKVDQVLTWGIIHIQCSDTKAKGNTLTRMTRQSGIGHATVTGGECVGNTIAYSGLYGIEVEGTGNKDIKVYDNIISYCLKGIAVISSINSYEVYGNTIAFCTYDLQLDANIDLNGSGVAQVFGSIHNNRTYDALFHYYIKDSTFVDLFNNTAMLRTANGYVPQRAEDQVVSVISPTEVLILNSANGTIAVGDVHQYTDGAGVARTVQAVTTQTDATYGSCWRVTYTTASSVVAFGSFFMRKVDFTAAFSTFFYLAGTKNSNINIWNNSENGPIGRAFDINGNQNVLRIRNNGVVGAATVFYAGDSTAITNSSIVCKRGEVQSPATGLFGGASPQKLFPSVVGEIRTAGMTAPTKPIVFTTTGSSQAFRLKLNLQGSTKTANTGNAVVSLNGTAVATIPVAQIGGALVKIDVQVSALADTFTLNLADTYGDMGFASAVFELHTIEV